MGVEAEVCEQFGPLGVLDKTVGQTETFLTGYPGGETDLDGLAVGGGKAYFVSDGPNTAQASFYVYNLGTGLFEAPLPSPFTGAGTFSAAAYAPGLVPEPASMLALGLGAENDGFGDLVHAAASRAGRILGRACAIGHLDHIACHTGGAQRLFHPFQTFRHLGPFVPAPP